jgi:hypothetical protein
LTKKETDFYLQLVRYKAIYFSEPKSLEGIIDRKTDGHAVEPADMYIKHGSNKKARKKTKVCTCVLNGSMGLQAGSVW